MTDKINIVGNDVLSKGYQFRFVVNNNVITTWGSSWNGKEIIKVNDEVVSEQRSYKRKSIHLFKVDDIPYEIEFNMIDILRGHLQCTLIEDGVHVETQSIAYKHPDVSGRQMLVDFGKWLLAGVVTGLLMGFIIANFVF
ncbi:hypothetical protein JQC92_19225 [Shewanella sp. 202IG2-18]|uniref:hypothetical protein n=1 Tax=Parashewanella hymeniacidonis TaxID=2807618 RepID=UPI00195FD537|nr:hypothetical protein [Parashewanella hymeniacidonis]MBM7074138.1 hypothetical protein [Parashewanella hymeniacidonis]